MEAALPNRILCSLIFDHDCGSTLQPARDATVMAACPLVMFAEAERPIGTLRGCASRRLARFGFCGGMDDLSVFVDVVLVVLEIALFDWSPTRLESTYALCHQRAP